jgi:hypothetical protein
MSSLHTLVRLGMDLGLAVNEFNSGITDNVGGVVRLTLEYLSKVRDAVRDNVIQEDAIGDYFALVGHAWSSLDESLYSGSSQPRGQPEGQEEDKASS